MPRQKKTAKEMHAMIAEEFPGLNFTVHRNNGIDWTAHCIASPSSVAALDQMLEEYLLDIRPQYELTE